MASLAEIYDWFMTGKKPTQAQFWASWGSFWNKLEQIPISAISGLTNILNAKAEKTQFDAHKTASDAHQALFELKQSLSEKGQANGYVPLNELAKIAAGFLNIVNDLETGGTTALASAETVKTLKAEINGIKELLTSDDVNLDTVQEIVNAIKTVETSLETILVNDLTTGGVTKALTAEMGKNLKALIDALGTNKVDKVAGERLINAAEIAKLAGVDAAIAAISPTIQTETTAYIQRIIAVGSSIDATSINAIDEFVVRGKAEGWYSSILNFAPVLGGSLAGALVKLVVEPGGASSMVGTNLVATDYNPRYGFRILTNSAAIGKWINTGLSPDALGLTTAGIGIGIYVSEDSTSTTESFIMGTAGTGGATAAGFDKIQATVNLGRLTISNVNHDVAIGGNRMQFVNIINSTTFQGYKNGVRTHNSTATTLTTVALTESITLYRNVNGSSFGWNAGSIGSFILTQPLTSTRASQLTKALYNLYIKVGRVQSQGNNIEWDGDSITAGQGVSLPSDRFANIVSAYIGGNMFNLGIPSGRMAVSGGDGVRAPVPLTLTAFDVDIPINTSFITMGVNDILATGDVISQGYQAALESVIQYKKDKGQRVIVNSPTYISKNTSGTLTQPLARQRTYLAAAANAASNKNVPFVNLLDAFLDTDDPYSYTTDGVHYIAPGHKIIADHEIAILQGQIFRLPKLDFSSIAAGASVDLTVDYMYGARANMTVLLGQPTAPVTGLTYQAFVSANDTVTVRATNNTGSAIDAASQVIKVTVIL